MPVYEINSSCIEDIGYISTQTANIEHVPNKGKGNNNVIVMQRKMQLKLQQA